MAQLDSTKIRIQSKTVEVGESKGTLQGTMAAQLRRAPWFVFSTVIHGVVLTLLWVLIPPGEKCVAGKMLGMVDTSKADVVQPPPAPPPETQPEETTGEVVINEALVVTGAEPSFDRTGGDVSRREPAFDSSQWNSAVGVGAGAGGRYRGRGSGRSGGRGDGTSFAEAIDAGLQWLQKHQDEDGKWDCDQFMKHDDPASDPCDGAGNAVHDIGVTGLALLACLGDGSTMRSGPYRETIKKGVLWLRSQQQENGLFGTMASHDFVYDHAIAAYAMCEAFGLSNSQLLADNAQRGLDYLELHRNPYSVWRYQPHDNDNDTSVTGWCIMAYESGEFFGLRVDKSALEMAAIWLDRVSDSTGLHGYTRQGEHSSRKPGGHQSRFPVGKGEALTAVGLFCRFFLGQDPMDKPVMKAAADLILAKPPVWDEKAGSIDHYYWYYATYALFQMGGRHWSEWQKKLETAVVKTQLRDQARKNAYGSWDPKCAWGEDGGRVYSTAILVLTLEAYYRYTKLLR